MLCELFIKCEMFLFECKSIDPCLVQVCMDVCVHACDSKTHVICVEPLVR